MRLELHIDIPGADLTAGETGMGEVERVVGRAMGKLWEGRVLQPGDSADLADTNETTVGYVRLVPDWTAGEEVWVTTEEGTLLRSTIHRVDRSATAPGFWAVTCRYRASYELLSPVVVDAWGCDGSGRPVMGRAR